MPAERSKHSLRSFRSAAAVVVGEGSKPSYGGVVPEAQGFFDRRNGARPDVVEGLLAGDEVERPVEVTADCDTAEKKI